MIDIERRAELAIIRLDHGKVHALDDVLLDGLVEGLDAVERSGARAVVLTATGGVFCAGVDLQQVVDGGADYLDQVPPRARLGLRPLVLVPASGRGRRERCRRRRRMHLGLRL